MDDSPMVNVPLLDGAGGFVVPLAIAAEVDKWLTSGHPRWDWVEDPPPQLLLTHKKERLMRRVIATVRIELGLMADESEVSAKRVVELLGILDRDAIAIEPIAVTFTDIDTGLIVSETVFGEDGQAEQC